MVAAPQLYASAPGFPHGVVDDIPALAALARQHRCGLHVDCCLGGFWLPFAKKCGRCRRCQCLSVRCSARCDETEAWVVVTARRLGHPVPPFDFSIAGVTSMSMDTHKVRSQVELLSSLPLSLRHSHAHLCPALTHKPFSFCSSSVHQYGQAQKGSSILLYSSRALRRFQFTAVTDWSGGLYVSPSQPGSRSGGLIAQTWAALMHLGEEGYMEATREVIDAAVKLAYGVNGIQGLEARAPVLWGDRSLLALWSRLVEASVANVSWPSAKAQAAALLFTENDAVPPERQPANGSTRAPTVRGA